MKSEVFRQVSKEAFQARYAAVDDPWSFETSAYEQSRYECTLEALSRQHYEVAYEPGCSVGVLTAKLATLATRVIATDFAPSAVERAQARCRGFPHVEIRCEDAASFDPGVPLDLVVFSELGYYFAAAELVRVAHRLASSLSTGGEFVAVHWLGRSEDHVLHGDEVHAALLSHLPLTWSHGKRYEGFRIDCWRR